MLGVRGEILLPHGVEDSPLHGLEPVADVGECAGGDDRKGVAQVSGLSRLVELHRDAVAARTGDGRSTSGREDAVKGKTPLPGPVELGSLSAFRRGSFAPPFTALAC
jgi:hypothetical protein